MSAGPDPSVDVKQVEQARRQVTRLAEEIAHLSEMDLTPADYYGEFLQRLLAAVAAPAGAVWLRTPQGNLQLQYQINMRQVGIDRDEETRKMHDELLRQAILKGQPGIIWPRSGPGPGEKGHAVAGNPTDHAILLAPILVEKELAGLIEIWQDHKLPQQAMSGFLQFMVKMSGHASGFTRNHQLRQMTGQQQVWTQLEAFARQIHASLNPTEVAYLVVNEGRRLVQADRISVAIRQGKRAPIYAISGADIVEKRSNLVQLMRRLFERVLAWGEKLVYSGTKDDTLPPAVLKALDAYLAESNSKLLVVLPLKDEREAESKKPARSAMMMECFDPAAAPEQMLARLEVVGKHAASALYNADAYRRIPMRFLWLPLARLQDGLGGKARAILTLCGVLLVALIAAMVLIPYPLKMEGNGQLLPRKRVYVYSPVPGIVKEIKSSLVSGSWVGQEEELIRMHDMDLGEKIYKLQTDILKYQNILRNRPKNTGKENERGISPDEIAEAQIYRDNLTMQLLDLQKNTNAILSKPGEFWIRSPMKGIILTGDFRETLNNRPVKPNEPLMRIGDADIKKPRVSEWEIELKIPQKNIGQVLAAYGVADVKGELDVDFLLKSQPTQTFKGKLARSKIAREANPNRDEHSETEPVVLAWVRIHGNDIPEESRLTPELVLSGTEVHARIRCGNHAMGYSLFYGVWEFFYEKIVFFF